MSAVRFFSITMALMFAWNGSAVAETVSGGQCQRWFLFWCVDRGDGIEVDYGGTRDENGRRYEPPMTQAKPVNGAPIMGPFTRAFNTCARGCSYVNWGIWGDKRHQQRRSCHNSGSAIDIHAIKCGGRTYKTGSSRFSNFVSCMDRQNNISKIHGHGDHKNHAHFALTTCHVGGRGKIRGDGRRIRGKR